MKSLSGIFITCNYSLDSAPYFFLFFALLVFSASACCFFFMMASIAGVGLGRSLTTTGELPAPLRTLAPFFLTSCVEGVVTAAADFFLVFLLMLGVRCCSVPLTYSDWSIAFFPTLAALLAATKA